MSYHRGDRVRTEGRIPKFGGRVGIVTTPNNLGEVGVTFRRQKVGPKAEADAWFLPRELTKLDGDRRTGENLSA